MPTVELDNEMRRLGDRGPDSGDTEFVAEHASDCCHGRQATVGFGQRPARRPGDTESAIRHIARLSRPGTIRGCAPRACAATAEIVRPEARACSRTAAASCPGSLTVNTIRVRAAEERQRVSAASTPTCHGPVVDQGPRRPRLWLRSEIKERAKHTGRVASLAQSDCRNHLRGVRGARERGLYSAPIRGLKALVVPKDVRS